MPRVDLINYTGREQAYIKHCLLEEYLPELAYKVGSAWNELVYVDGFAGPWQAKAHSYLPYADLFCEAMTFPLVTSDDLVNWLTNLEPHIRLELSGSIRRRKPSPLHDDKVIVITPGSLR